MAARCALVLVDYQRAFQLVSAKAKRAYAASSRCWRSLLDVCADSLSANALAVAQTGTGNRPPVGSGTLCDPGQLTLVSRDRVHNANHDANVVHAIEKRARSKASPRRACDRLQRPHLEPPVRRRPAIPRPCSSTYAP